VASRDRPERAGAGWGRLGQAGASWGRLGQVGADWGKFKLAQCSHCFFCRLCVLFTIYVSAKVDWSKIDGSSQTKTASLGKRRNR